MLPSSYVENEKMLVKRKGARVIDSVLKADYTKVEVPPEKEKYAGNIHGFRLLNGKPAMKTITQLEAEQAIEDKKNAKQDLKVLRNEKLNNSTIDYKGSVYQVRPSDYINFETMISILDEAPEGTTIKWTLEDDTEEDVTKEDLKAIFMLGKKAGAQIDKEYRDAVREL